MSSDTAVEKRMQCPWCGKMANRVSPVTLRALLKDEFASEFGGDHSCPSNGNASTGSAPISSDTPWRFCESQECDVVYFSETGHRVFTKSQLRVAVGVKEKTGDRPLRYCFGHTMASIKKKLLTTSRSDALEDIRAKMKDPGCHCETENPSGSCCLRTVAKGTQIAKQELAMDPASEQPLTSSTKAASNCGEMLTKIGTVASAIMASACCWLPLVLLAVGVSGAGIAATLEAYRPLFIVVTFGFLGAAFHFTYRPKKAAGGAHACCGPEATEVEDCYAPATKGRRFSMMTMNKLMLWVVTVLAIAFLFFPSYVGALLGSADGNQVTDDMNTVVFKMEGMTCDGCASIVEKAIRNVPGVLAVEVDYEKRQAVVGTEICCPVPKDKIISALQHAGYGARVSESSESLQDLSSDAREFKAAFNEAKGQVRIVMLVSPG
ncbi:MAG: cation transporter [Planctomycetia bacterium]|nr:cation transporter [Planctomycetia bacterium]